MTKPYTSAHDALTDLHEVYAKLRTIHEAAEDRNERWATAPGVRERTRVAQEAIERLQLTLRLGVAEGYDVSPTAPSTLPEEADDAATMIVGSDRYPYTVISRSKSGHKLTLRRDKATRTDKNGQSEMQEYTYEADPEGDTFFAYRGHDGRYKSDGAPLRLGRREKYSDPSF